MFNSTSAGISTTILFQNGVSEVTQNNLLIISVFASPDEESDENNDDAGEDTQGLPDEESDENNDDAGEDTQGLPDEESDENNDDAGEDTQGLQDVENTTTVNPSLTALSEPPQNQECPDGSPPGCYVIGGGLSRQCPSDAITVKNTPGGPEGTMCAPIPPEECPDGSPPGCYVIGGGLSRQCPSDAITVKNTPGGPEGTCAHLFHQRNVQMDHHQDAM